MTNIFAKPASAIGANTVAFIAATRTADNASTPFARSALAAIVGGLSSVAMTEALVVASFGSPKGAKGKPVKRVSGLRDYEGGARLYQAWKDVSFLADNIDADAFLVAPDTDEDAPEGVVGAAAIRPLIVGFILAEKDAPKALFGATGLTAKVKALVAAHAEAVAKLHGVEADTPAEGDNDNAEGEGDVSLADRIAALVVAINAADNETIISLEGPLQTLRDAMDDRYSAALDALTAADPAPVAEAA